MAGKISNRALLLWIAVALIALAAIVISRSGSQEDLTPEKPVDPNREILEGVDARPPFDIFDDSADYRRLVVTARSLFA